MDSLQPISSNQYFARKKALVSYLLSIFVFWVHISSYDNYEGFPGWFRQVRWLTEDLVTPEAVPMFFLISGTLFFRNYTPAAYGSKLKSRVRSLVIPYFGWNIVMLLFQMVSTLFLSRFFVGREPFVLSWENVLGGLFHWKYNSVMWYVFTLMLFAVMAPIWDLLLRKKSIAFGAVILLWILSQFGIGLPESIFTSRISIIFYLLGGICGRFYWDVFSGDSGKKYVLPSLAGILCCLVYQYAACRRWITSTSMPFTAMVAVYSVSLWIFADTLCRHVTVRKFMEHSFWVYAMHINVGSLFSKLWYLLLPKHWGFAIPNFLLTTLCTLVFVEISCQILKRWLPPIYRALSGAR